MTYPADDTCPKCGGELDTGWECNDCGFDVIASKILVIHFDRRTFHRLNEPCKAGVCP